MKRVGQVGRTGDEERGDRSLPNPFSPLFTALYVAAWTLVMLQGWGSRIDSSPTAWLSDPANTAQRVIVRDLELAEANESPGLLQPVRRALFGSFEEVLDVSVAIQRDATESIAARVGIEGDGEDEGFEDLLQSNAGLSVLLAEAGELQKAFERAEQTLDPEIESAIRTIYGERAGDKPTTPKVNRRALESLAEAGLSDWLLERPAVRLLARAGKTEPAANISRRIERRGARWQRRVEALTAANYLLIAAGAVLIAAMARGAAQRKFSPHNSSANDSPSNNVVPWSMALGFAVLVRADFWNRFYFVTLNQLAIQFSQPEWLDPFYTWGTLIASLPLLWLIHRYLLVSSPVGFFKTFGLSPTQLRASAVFSIAAAALAIDLLGTTALAWGSWGLGFEGHWAEGLDETLIWGSTREVIESCIDYMLWTPIFEELVFRGLLFYTLRNRFGAWEAAAMSAVLFSAIHFYSLPGFLMTFWSGFVWAIAFERARSLLPGILAHSVYNLFFVLGILLVYR